MVRVSRVIRRSQQRRAGSHRDHGDGTRWVLRKVSPVVRHHKILIVGSTLGAIQVSHPAVKGCQLPLHLRTAAHPECRAPPRVNSTLFGKS